MELTKKDIIYSSFVGVEAVQRFKLLQNQLSKHVLPPIPFLGHNNENKPIAISNLGESTEVAFKINPTVTIWEADASPSYNEQFFPFSFIAQSGIKYLLPYEPMISISGKNTIVRRQVAKAQSTVKGGVSLGGSIKERWTQDDYEITISGVLIGSILTGDVSMCYPRYDFERLREIITAPKSLKVECEPLQLLGINQIVIEDFSFPFTKGENVQAYEIKAYSDFDYKLLLEIND